jgi:CHASE2 domain-containing sensor protein
MPGLTPALILKKAFAWQSPYFAAARKRLPRIGSIREAWLSALLLPVIFVAMVYSASYLLSDLRLFADPVQSALDQRMTISADTRGPDTMMTFVDFDDRSLAGLGDPALVPIEAAAHVLRQLIRAAPRAILVDLDLSYVRDPGDLKALRELFAEAREARIPLLLVRDALPPFDDRPMRYRETPLEVDVANSPNMMWVGAVPAGSDDIVRFMPAVQGAAYRGKQRQLPAPALALDLIERSGSALAARAIFRDSIAGASSCGSGSREYWTLCTPGGAIRALPHPGERIEFALGWPGVDDRLPVRSALSLTTASAFDPSVFTGRFAIVGTSAARRDQAATPIGRMPGAMVHANAIHSWRTHGPGYSRRYLPGLALAMILTALCALVIVLAIRAFPSRFRGTARDWAPPAMTALFWFVFYLAPVPATAGLIAVVYIATTMVAFGERRLERAQRRRT